MTDDQLIAEYLAKGGTVTVCPPQKFSEHIAEPGHWSEQLGCGWRIYDRNRRFKAAAKKRGEATPEPVVSAEVLRPVGPPPQEPGAKARPKRRTAVAKPKSGRSTGGRFRHTDAEIRAAAEGRTSIEAAEILGCSPKSVRRNAARLGITLKPHQRDTGATPVEPIIAAIKAGMTIDQAAEHLSISAATVSKRLSVAGLSVSALTGEGRSRGKNTPQPIAICGHTWPGGLHDAAEDLRMNPQTLRSRLHSGKPRSARLLAEAVAAWEGRKA
jgi:DNA-binding CsgD family transcriptional regulator